MDSVLSCGRMDDRNPDLPQFCVMQSGRSTTELYALGDYGLLLDNIKYILQ